MGKKEKENKIIVIYVGILDYKTNEVVNNLEEFIDAVSSKIIPETFSGEIIVIPTFDVNTKIECINPRYITEEELIKENNILIKKLNESLTEEL